MITIDIDASQITRLEEAVKRAGKNIKKEVSGAIREVSKKTKRDMGKLIRDEVTLKKAVSEREISVTLSTEQTLTAVVSLKKYTGTKSGRLGLRHFGARQDRRGVSYKISRKGGRARINGAFQGPRPGLMKMSWKGNVFIREGTARLPIRQLMGVSALGVYLKNDMSGPQAKVVEADLVKQIERRINLNILRAEGLVKT